MPYRNARQVFAAAALAALAACGSGAVDVDLQLKATLDGRPVRDAEVYLDGEAAGRTDAKGLFASTLRRSPGQTVLIAVKVEGGKFRAKPWARSVVVAARGAGDAAEIVKVAAKLERYVVIRARHRGKPVAGAQINIEGQPVGATAENGEFEYVFVKLPRRGLNVSVTKEGLGQTSVRYRGESGGHIEMVFRTRSPRQRAAHR